MADTLRRRTAPRRAIHSERVHESQGRHPRRHGWIQRLPRRTQASRAQRATRRDPRATAVRSVEAADWLAGVRQKGLRWTLVASQVRAGLLRMPLCTQTRELLSPDAPPMEPACASVAYRPRLPSRTAVSVAGSRLAGLAVTRGTLGGSRPRPGCWVVGSPGRAHPARS